MAINYAKFMALTSGFRITSSNGPLDGRSVVELDEQIKLILQLNLDVTLSFDNDKAGNKAREKAKKAFKNKVTLRDVILPEGKDPADISEEELLKAYLERKKII